jgi:hypothetical protein
MLKESAAHAQQERSCYFSGYDAHIPEPNAESLLTWFYLPVSQATCYVNASFHHQ